MPDTNPPVEPMTPRLIPTEPTPLAQWINQHVEATNGDIDQALRNIADEIGIHDE